MRKTLSVAIITRNEEANLERTLGSVAWADEVIVVDSGSDDRTEEIARSFGCPLFLRSGRVLLHRKTPPSTNAAVTGCFRSMLTRL